eukprot:6156457-Prymnesium_polylepis.1
MEGARRAVLGERRATELVRGGRQGQRGARRQHKHEGSLTTWRVPPHPNVAAAAFLGACFTVVHASWACFIVTLQSSASVSDSFIGPSGAPRESNRGPLHY